MTYSVNIITTDNTLVNIPFKQYEYPNLMELIVDTYYEDIGECLGRGLCGTCHVILVSSELNGIIDINEEKTLSTLYNKNKNSRLACQIMLTEKINNQTFKIMTEEQ